MEQTRLWLKHGPDKAVSLLVAALRTALLFGNEVLLDRNQIFDGVFFVAVTPASLRWYLGIAPDARLPIKIRLLDSNREQGDFGLTGMTTWGVATNISRKIEANYEAVVDDPDRLSSVERALSPQDPNTNNWLYEAYILNTAPVPVASLPPEYDNDLIDERRRLWVDELSNGHAEVQDWELNYNWSEELKNTLTSNIPHDSSTVMKLLANLSSSTANDITRRSLIIKWLQDEEVAEFQPPTLRQSLAEHGAKPELNRDEIKAAFAWWNRLYYQAIAERDGINFYFFDDNPKSSEKKKLDISSVIAATFSKKGKIRNDATIFQVQGDILERIERFNPAQYSSLRSYSMQNALTPNKETSTWYHDRALAIRDVDAKIGKRQNRLRYTWTKIALAFLFILLTHFADVQFIQTSDLLISAVAIMLFARSLPLSDVRESISLSKFSLSGTLIINADKIHHTPQKPNLPKKSIGNKVVERNTQMNSKNKRLLPAAGVAALALFLSACAGGAGAAPGRTPMSTVNAAIQAVLDDDATTYCELSYGAGHTNMGDCERSFAQLRQAAAQPRRISGLTAPDGGQLDLGTTLDLIEARECSVRTHETVRSIIFCQAPDLFDVGGLAVEVVRINPTESGSVWRLASRVL